MISLFPYIFLIKRNPNDLSLATDNMKADDVKPSAGGGWLANALVIALNLLLVLSLCGNWIGALILFGVSYCFLLVKSLLSRRVVVPVLFFGVLCIVGLTLLGRQSYLIGPVLTILGEGWFSSSLSHPVVFGLRLVGASYCFLRILYAVFDDRTWTLLEYTHYFFFFPTYFSGPIARPADLLETKSSVTRGKMQAGIHRILGGVIRIALAQILLSLIPLGSSAQLIWAAEESSAFVLWIGTISITNSISIII